MISIDNESCTACGICGTVCPRHIIETFEEKDEKHTRVSQVRKDLCMVCGHCTAVCPSDAIRVLGLDFDAFKPVRPLEITEDGLLTLMEQRRSVRRYKDKPVPRETLNRIIEASHRAPTGTGRQSTGVLVIDKPETLEALSKMLHELYQELDKVLYDNYEDAWLYWSISVVAHRKEIRGYNHQLALQGREGYCRSHHTWFKNGRRPR